MSIENDFLKSQKTLNSELENAAIVSNWNLQVPNYQGFPLDAFLHGYCVLRKGLIKLLKQRAFEGKDHDER